MIDAAQDVVDAKDDVRPRDLVGTAAIVRRPVELHRWLRGRERIHAALAIEPDHLHHGRGVALADALDRQRAFQAIAPAAQRAWPGRTTLRPARDEIASHRALVARGGPLPEELARGGLPDLHLPHAHLVCSRRRGRERQDGDDREDQRDASAHSMLPGVGTSYVTLYFFASARTTAVLCSAAVASIQSDRKSTR